MKCTSPPACAAATDWFEPLPPGPSAKVWPRMVSPIRGCAVGAVGGVGDEDAEDDDLAGHGRSGSASGGITPLRKMKQP